MILFSVIISVLSEILFLQFGCDSKKGKQGTEGMVKHGFSQMMRILSLFNITSDRFILHKHVYAREIYFPMEGGCQDPIYNTWQILTMRKLVFEKLGLEDRNLTAMSFSTPTTRGKKYKKVMTLLKRSTNSVHTRNNFDSVRQWNDAFTSQLLELLKKTFPHYEIVLLSDRDEKIMKCFECQVKVFARTDVLIGIHGAGLGMSLYMPPNSAVVEIAPYINDGRCLLGGGPFSRLAALMAHNYMIHQPQYEEFKWRGDKTSEFNITAFVVHLQSFLVSIA
jgi:hypothetical protein